MTGGPAATRARLNFSEPVPVTYESRRLLDGTGQVATVAQVFAQSAYFIESIARDRNNAQMGPITVVHFGALNREIAKETQSYDGTWVRTLTAYDAAGLAAATYSAHFVTETDLTAYRQFTRLRDLRHRPLVQEFVAVEGQAAVQITVQYNGLETRSTDPAGRVTITRKNAAGQTAQTVDATGATLNMAYDAKGNLTRTRDALGNETSVTYNTRGFKTAMTDPNTGTWTYHYNALGELIRQTNALNQVVTMRYDLLGRMFERDEPSMRARWVYDTAPMGRGKLAESFTLLANDSREAQQTYTYDSLGRPDSSTHLIQGRSYTSRVTYHPDTGQPLTQTYPTGFRLRYQYNALGFVQRVGTDTGTGIGQVYWSVDSLGTGVNPFDAKGNLVRQRFGDTANSAGIQTWHVHDRASGKARQLRAGVANGSFGIQNQTYTYDRQRGVLTTRSEANTGLTETFDYDTLDRLTLHSLANTGVPAANRAVSVRYNALGNILFKSDVGVYLYGASGAGRVRPHAVTSVAGSSYTYDSNGQLTTTSGTVARKNIWTSFGLPISMEGPGRRTVWVYGPDRQRLSSTTGTVTGGIDGPMTPTRRQDLVNPDARGGLFFEREETLVSGAVTQVENRHYITVAGGVVAVVKTLGNGNGTAPATGSGITRAVSDQTQYWHKDHLGSIVAVTNARGELVERSAFDAWGRRMNPSGAPDTGTLAAGNTMNAAHGDRGFTGHEMLDELGLVHMNGRIYDPVLGRFFSADPYIQAPEMLQNYNRYSYVLNNPLGYTDPSGEIVEWVALWVVGAIMAAEGNKYWKMVGQVLMAYAGYQFGVAGVQEPGMALKMQAAGFSGFASGMVTSGGDPAAALQEGLFAAMTAGVGNTLKGVELIVAHAALGCARAAASGGECGPSAMAAAAGKLMTLQIEGLNLTEPAEFMATVIAGGTASVIGGGKFANGAGQAAFGYLFNKLTEGAIQYRYRLSKGHHNVMPLQVAQRFADFLTDEAIDYLAGRTIGANIPHNDKNSPHKWGEGHNKFNQAIERELRDYMSSKGISQEQKMSVKQAAEFQTRIMALLKFEWVSGHAG